MTTSEIGKITGYHAHIYYHLETRKTAAKIRDTLDAKFRGAICLGRWHDKNIGPHTRSMYQVAFDRTVFPEIVPWLALNRDGLAILVHPESGDGLADHTAHAIWMGEMPLRLTKASSTNKTHPISFSEPQNNRCAALGLRLAPFMLLPPDFVVFVGAPLLSITS